MNIFQAFLMCCLKRFSCCLCAEPKESASKASTTGLHHFDLKVATQFPQRLQGTNCSFLVIREVTSKLIGNRHPLPLNAHSDSDSEAPNMFDVIDSLESGSRVESMHEKAGTMHTVCKIHRLELHCRFETCALRRFPSLLQFRRT